MRETDIVSVWSLGRFVAQEPRSGAIQLRGWYDWQSKSILEGSERMTDLQPVLEKAREPGMGLVVMKAARHIAGRQSLPWGNPDAFDEYYDQNLRAALLSPFQRSNAYVLAHELDVVSSDIRSPAQLEGNIIATATSPKYFA